MKARDNAFIIQGRIKFHEHGFCHLLKTPQDWVLLDSNGTEGPFMFRGDPGQADSTVTSAP